MACSNFCRVNASPDKVGGDSRPGKPANKTIERSLFDLEADPEESISLAAGPGYAGVVADLENVLRGIVDP